MDIKEMIKNEYFEDVKAHVNNNIELAFTASNRELSNIYQGIISDANYRNMLVNAISEVGITHSMTSYKLDLNTTIRKEVFMRKINEFLHPANILLLAEHIDAMMALEETNKQTR